MCSKTSITTRSIVPEPPGEVGDAIGLDVEFLQLSQIADLCGQIFQLVSLEIQHTKVAQCRDAFGQTLHMHGDPLYPPTRTDEC